MALTKEDLQAIAALMDSKLAEQEQRLTAKMATKDDVQEVYKETRRINGTVSNIEVEHGKKLSALMDGQSQMAREGDMVRKFDRALLDHEERIFKLEVAAAGE